MQRTETAEIFEYLALIDGRKITPDKIMAWHNLLGFLEYSVAREAMFDCQRDPNIHYIEPKHIISASYKVKERIKTEEARKRAEEFLTPKQGTPMPKCQHGIGLLLCDPCCRSAAQLAGLIK